jgi:hypothetical protein
MPIGKIRMQVSQGQSGGTVHTVSVGTDPSQLTSVYVWNSSTSDGQWLEAGGDVGSYKGGNVRYVRVTTTASPSWVAWREIEVYSSVEYFGYINDKGTDAAGAAGANLSWADSFFPSTDAEADLTQLTSIRNHGRKALVVLPALVFQNRDPGTGLCANSVDATILAKCGCAPGGPSCDWRDRLTRVMSAKVNAGYLDSVVAFYIADEPNFEGGVVRDNVSAVVQYIRQAWWSKPAATIIADAHVSNLPSYASWFQSTFDWVGFDCYGPWTSCGSWHGSNFQMASLISTLRSALAPNQRMIAVPTADDFGYDQDTLIEQNINKWHNELISDAKYIAVAPYQWSGAQTLSSVKKRLRQLARSLLFPQDPHLYPVDQWASSFYGGYLPFSAFDVDPSTYWTAGALPEYWVAMSFGGSTRVSSIMLLSALSPSPSSTTHIIEGCPPLTDCRQSPSAWDMVQTIGVNRDGQYVTVDLLPLTAYWEVSGLRVRTPQGNGTAWQGWREFHALQARPLQHATMITASPSGFGRDGYHLDLNGALWHQNPNPPYGWSQVPYAPSLPAGGFARLTNVDAPNFDAIVIVGSDGHLYQYFTLGGSSYAWYDMGLPTGCDGVVGTPTVAASSSQLDISYRCYNDHVGTASSQLDGPGSWTFTDIDPNGVPTGAAGDPSEGLAGSTGLIYVVGHDGRLYRCYAGGNPPCSFENGNNYPYGVTFVGTPGVAFSRSDSTARWVLVADSNGNMWQYDAYYGWWTNLGLAACGMIEGDVSAAVDGPSSLLKNPEI